VGRGVDRELEVREREEVSDAPFPFSFFDVWCS